MGDNGALALTPVIIGVAIGASALTLLAFWAYEQRKDPQRRWIAAAVLAVGALFYTAWVWGALVAPRIVSFTHRTVVSDGWAGPDLTIAVLAAPRFGPRGLDTEGMQRLITRINARDPDLVLVLGDLTAPHLAQASMEDRFAVTLSLGALARLEADLGVVAVLGALDGAYGREGLSRDLEDAGVAVLWNRAVVVERAGAPFAIAGLAPGDEADAAAARASVPDGMAVITAAGSAVTGDAAGSSALFVTAAARCAAVLGCGAPAGLEGPFVGTAGLQGGGLAAPEIMFLTLRAENPN